MRNLTSGMVTAVQKTVLHPVIFFEGEFTTGGGSFVRVWSGIGSITWNSLTWTGVGHLGGLSAILESDDLRANGVAVSLSGIPAALISTALADARQGLPGKIWIGEIDPDTLAITADPFLAFEGRLDVPEIEDGGDTAVIRINYESRMIEADLASNHRYTDETQQHFFLGDLGFEFVPEVQNWTGVWGRA